MRDAHAVGHRALKLGDGGAADVLLRVEHLGHRVEQRLTQRRVQRVKVDERDAHRHGRALGRSPSNQLAK